MGAKIKVLCSTGMKRILETLAPDFERATGHNLEISYGPANALKLQIETGEVADVAILTGPVIEELSSKGVLAADSRVDLARSLIGVAVRAGAPKPDISSVEAFRSTLISARSVAYTSTGASGLQVEKLIEQLGMTATIKPKSKRPPGGYAADLIVTGEAELALQNISELIAVTGVELVGPLPPQLQHPTLFSAAILAGASHTEGGRSLIGLLSAAQTAPLLQAHGMEVG
ncbi:MAG TPA: substrate-binding domain-containing protein [Xanthobacteraceae bacterium]|jgi:molybdate transport system substrate-binding protein|nr:substrate-binding domain-containing protein [Xanthobacteraceae bacterium]